MRSSGALAVRIRWARRSKRSRCQSRQRKSARQQGRRNPLLHHSPPLLSSRTKERPPLRFRRRRRGSRLRHWLSSSLASAHLRERASKPLPEAPSLVFMSFPERAGAWYPQLPLPRLRTYEASPRLGLYYGPWKPGCPGPALKQLAGRSAKGPVQFGSAKAGMAIAKAIAPTTRATVKSMSMRCMFFTSSPLSPKGKPAHLSVRRRR
jgi:hypothetical protein